MAWSLYEKDSENKEKFLKPLLFSNNKTQEDVVNEILGAIEKGSKIIFIKGVCGTGKSAIALNLAQKIGKASIVVPVKNLQKQYEQDYVEKKYLLKNNEKLKINVITGRKNHECLFFKEFPEFFKQEKQKEKDSTLYIFDEDQIQNDFEVNFNKKTSENNKSTDNSFLPCKIEIKKQNFEIIKKYLKQNPKIKYNNFLTTRDIRRMSIAPVCPYWSPIIPSHMDIGVLDDAKQKKYTGLKHIGYTIYSRKTGCKYYEQFNSYIDSDVIIFNSQKYKLETVMNRKPSTDIEIIDECDEFLDSFSNIEKINLNRLNLSLSELYAESEKSEKIISELIKITGKIIKDKKISDYILNEDIIPIKETEIYKLLGIFLDTNFLNYVEADEENYCFQCEEISKIFENIFKETYVTFHKDSRDIIVQIVTINLEKRFKELLQKNKVLVLMSGTIHSEKVLKNIFGIKDFKIIEAETKMPGKITKLKTGMEMNCKYENFKNKRFSRKQYLVSLSKCIETSKKPVLIHVNSFADLPNEKEAQEYNLFIMTREKLKQIQKKDKTGEIIKKFKKKQIPVLYSTKCNRGVDFPGNVCNSIILTKYPYPNINSIFWKILKKTNPENYNEFYVDKANREFSQRIYRGLRSNDDHIYILSPDSRVFEKL